MIFLIVFFFAIMLFGFVVFRGAPYVPTLNAQVRDAFELLDLKSGQTLLELGCGDGRLLRYAAEHGVYSVGYELNPLLVLSIRLRHWRYRRYIRVIWGDYWLKDWPPSDGMYVFLLDRYMKKLDKKVAHYAGKKQYPLVSFAFEIPGRKAAARRSGVRLYIYNA